MRLMYHAACKVEFQPFKLLYSQLTFFNFLYFFVKNKKNIELLVVTSSTDKTAATYVLQNKYFVYR